MELKFEKVGKRKYFDKSVLRFIDLHRHISNDPEKIIRSLIRNRLKEARNSLWNGPPFDPRILASILGIQCEESSDLIRSKDAELHPTVAGGLVIRFNPDRPKTRKNFSIAHEISHTFFPNYQDRFHTRHKVEKYNPLNELEILCDLGASEIIMPTPEFDSDVHQSGISLDSLKQLSTRYEASREATAIRMVRTQICPCALLVLDYDYKPKELPAIENEDTQLPLIGDPTWWLPLKKLRVEYFVSSKRFLELIPMHKSIDESCAFYDVSVTKDEFRGDVCIHLNSRRLEFFAEAMAIPHTNHPELGSRVLAILFQQ